MCRLRDLFSGCWLFDPALNRIRQSHRAASGPCAGRAAVTVYTSAALLTAALSEHYEALIDVLSHRFTGQSLLLWCKYMIYDIYICFMIFILDIRCILNESVHSLY